jgi:hypothetical protein
VGGDADKILADGEGEQLGSLIIEAGSDMGRDGRRLSMLYGATR